MKKLILFTTALVAFSAFGEVKVGSPAPTFSETDVNGKTVTNKDITGSWTVIEWYNKDCPYVKKHYGSKNMQGLQKKYTAKGVKWIKVTTGAEGKEGHMTPAQAKSDLLDSDSTVTAFLLDTDGNMGRAFGAKTTPHMYVINPKGAVVYAGAIDDNTSAKPSVIPTSKNYVSAALDEALANKPISVSSSTPYGCSVKY